MKASFPLAWKILLVAVLNVAMLAAAAAVFVEYELGHEFASALLSPGRERIVSLARQLALDLRSTDVADRDALVERYRREHGVTFILFANNAAQLAGPRLTVPPDVIRRITERPPPGRAPEDRPPFVRIGPQPLPPGPPFLVTVDGRDRYWVGVRIPVSARDRDLVIPGTVVLVSSSLLGNPLYFQPLPWLTIAGVTLGITALCWLPFVRGATRSIGAMTRATGDIAEGRFEVRLPPRRDELGVLAAAIQSMAARLQALVDGQQRFLRDAAHELRSPLGRMTLSLGLVARESDDRAARHVADLREELELMTGLTDGLLAFARAEAAVDERRLVPTSVREAAERAVRVEAASADVRVDVDPDLRATADPDLLFRALANLLRNAVTHAAAAGPIEIRAWRDAGGVGVSVSDRGGGVPEADLERLFMPFYRPEPSRDRRTGGTGLGLAIVRAAVEACRGSASCRNLSPAGFEVTLRLPAA